jgi:hypothetical protein
MIYKEIPDSFKVDYMDSWNKLDVKKKVVKGESPPVISIEITSVLFCLQHWS